MTRDQIVEWIRRYAAVIAEQKHYLTELDAAVGDGDHGLNMDRGMAEVTAKLDGLADRDIGAILNAVGMTLALQGWRRCRAALWHAFLCDSARKRPANSN